jgi:hypothetical protein
MRKILATLGAAALVVGLTGSHGGVTASTGDLTLPRAIRVPAGTVLPIALESHVASDTSRVEDVVRARTRRAIVIDGDTAIPAGSTLIGHVSSVQRSGRVKGRARIAFRFDQLQVAGTGERLRISTSTIARQAPGTKGRDAQVIGFPAAGGAVIGAITGGKKGAAIGAAAGGGAGTAVVLSTRGREVRLGPGAVTTVRLLQPVTVR